MVPRQPCAWVDKGIPTCLLRPSKSWSKLASKRKDARCVQDMVDRKAVTTENGGPVINSRALPHPESFLQNVLLLSASGKLTLSFDLASTNSTHIYWASYFVHKITQISKTQD